ncbi:hypothetical protein [Vallitalea guaymasensis]|uniref:hypothetical protein n=1 Tax=Vallitalea guaymasensis TaxID=1185412 RepID=UPI002356C5FD|nr:hypothetical protein [Vallitalea guaymasensis]
MYKVSLYLGLSDKADMHSNINAFKMIGNAPLYLKPSSFTLPNNTYGTALNKIQISFALLLTF